ncbi:MAG: hypothetical protein GY832_32560 [Chloroflexi bacterium]|nr:hypothetical protein [Chloroflexota bacterium]
MPTLILSDLHLGPGRDPRTGTYSAEEDFFADDAFAALLDHYHKQSDGDPEPYPPSQGGPRGVTLVLAGDTLNLWEMDPLDELHTIATGHPIFFDALRRWLETGNHIHIIPGNHDFQLAFPDVQTALQNLISLPHSPFVRATHSAPSISPQRAFPTTSHTLAAKSVDGNASPSASTPQTPPGEITFGHFYHDPPARLYVEHGDRYTNPRKPGRPPNSHRRDYYFTSVLKHRLPVANVYRAHYISQVLATDPLAMLPAWRNLPGYLFDPPFELPARASSENVTLHTININIIQANWKRAKSQARMMHALIITSVLLKLAASALPGAALAILLSPPSQGGIKGGWLLVLLAAAAIARTFGAAAAHTSQNLAQIDLPRAAAEDIAPAIARARVQTLIFGHSHIPDRTRYLSPPRGGVGGGSVTYINTGTWTNVIAPLSAVAPPTRTYAHVDDDGTPRLLQWIDHGPAEPILIRRD